MAKSVSNLVKFPLVLQARASEVELLDQFGVKDGMTGYLPANKMRAIFENELHEQYPSLTRIKGEMSKSEFVLLVIYMMSKVDDKDILLVGKLFDRLDVKSAGYLTLDHISKEVQAAETRDTSLLMAEAENQLHEKGRGASFSEVLQRTLSSVLASGGGGNGGNGGSVNGGNVNGGNGGGCGSTLLSSSSSLSSSSLNSNHHINSSIEDNQFKQPQQPQQPQPQSRNRGSSMGSGSGSGLRLGLGLGGISSTRATRSRSPPHRVLMTASKPGITHNH